MKRTTALLLGLAFGAVPALAAPAAAQDAAGAATPAPMTAIRGSWQQMTAWVTAAAEQVPDSLYAYRPTPEVRSFGELIGHVAGSQNMICAVALGEAAPEEDAVEKSRTTKAELVQALKESTAYCERAYGQPLETTYQPATIFGMEGTRFSVLTLNATHNAEHYGNIVTYMRLNGMVPPSSQPRQ